MSTCKGIGGMDQEEVMSVPKAENGSEDARKPADLDRCYGRIGISAVLAALTYKGESKNSAYVPSEAQR